MPGPLVQKSGLVLLHPDMRPKRPLCGGSKRPYLGEVRKEDNFASPISSKDPGVGNRLLSMESSRDVWLSEDALEFLRADSEPEERELVSRHQGTARRNSFRETGDRS